MTATLIYIALAWRARNVCCRRSPGRWRGPPLQREPSGCRKPPAEPAGSLSFPAAAHRLPRPALRAPPARCSARLGIPSGRCPHMVSTCFADLLLRARGRILWYHPGLGISPTGSARGTPRGRTIAHPSRFPIQYWVVVVQCGILTDLWGVTMDNRQQRHSGIRGRKESDADRSGMEQAAGGGNGEPSKERPVHWKQAIAALLAG